jgi:UPF0716 protein FxsA
MLRLLPALLLLGLPIIEIAGFVIVGRQIGVLATIALVLTSMVVGSLLMRWQGFSLIDRIRREMQAGRDPSRELAHGFMILLAGILLVIPGFFTDIVGLLLFLPPVRDLVWRGLRRRMATGGSFTVFTSGFPRGPSGGRGPTIDLDSDDYSSGGPKPGSPWRRIDGR